MLLGVVSRYNKTKAAGLPIPPPLLLEFRAYHQSKKVAARASKKDRDAHIIPWKWES